MLYLGNDSDSDLEDKDSNENSEFVTNPTNHTPKYNVNSPSSRISNGVSS